MLFSIIFFIAFSTGYGVQGMDLNGILGRRNCYPQEQPNCNESFTGAYPELSKSSTGMTEAKTWFWLFTVNNTDTPENLHKCGGKLPPGSNFNPDKGLIVIVIPFITGFCEIAVYREWLHEILKRGGYNVLVVDYSWGNKLDYKTATLNGVIVAKQTVVVLKNIQSETGIGKEQITLIGHSMGAQIAGLIGRDFPVNRITALDPSGPLYDAEKTPPEDRLDPSDADLVEVWHCNVGKCLPYFGILYDVGHVNFYINGGRVQSACHKQAFKSLAKGDVIYGFATLLSLPTCYHALCAEYYKVSINPGKCQFVGVKCDSCSDFEAGKCNRCGTNGENCLIMGFDTDKYITGNISSPQKYYLTTGYKCPYCENCTHLEGYSDTYESSLQETGENPHPSMCSKRMRCIDS